MGKGYMAVCGKEESYISKMYEYIVTTYGEDFEVVLFTKEELFEEFAKENEVTICIYEEDFYIPADARVKVKAKLSEDRDREDMIYKYMSCEKILKEVMSMSAAKAVESRDFNTQGKKLIGVYTPVKRCFQTTFALTLGQILAKTHKVLYLNFESYSGFEMLGKSNGKTDLRDLVYFSECRGDNLQYRINAIKDKIGNLDYISPVKAYIRYSEISKEQWEKLIDNILEKTDYEYLILDLSEAVNGLLSILRKCSRIYTITDSDRMATAKVAQYENLLRESYYEDILDKTENIMLPKFREIPTEFEMLPYCELASYLKKIIDFDWDAKNDRDIY